MIVGKVYANWCGHCQDLIPKWAALKDNMSNSNVEFVEFEEADVDGRNAFEATHKPIEVNGYPTIFKIKPDGPVEYYNGSRTPEDMEQWILPSKKTFRRIKKQTNKKQTRQTRQTNIKQTKQTKGGNKSRRKK